MTAKLNGSVEAILLLGKVAEAVQSIRADVTEIKREHHRRMARVERELIALKARVKPRLWERVNLNLPKGVLIRFILAGVFTVVAAIMRIEPEWVAKVFSLIR